VLKDQAVAVGSKFLQQDGTRAKSLLALLKMNLLKTNGYDRHFLTFLSTNIPATTYTSGPNNK
jgi:hypothetical protein